MRKVQGEALGAPLGSLLDYGFKELADAGFEAVTGERVRVMVEKVFDRLRLHCTRRRQRIDQGPPDIATMVKDVRAEMLNFLTNQQEAADVAFKVLDRHYLGLVSREGRQQAEGGGGVGGG